MSKRQCRSDALRAAWACTCRAKADILERFNGHGLDVEIQFKKDRKPRTWHYDNITVWPEGIGAAACFVLDDEGQLVESDVLEGEVLVLDMGAYTLDALKMSNGNFNPEELEHATFENGGIMTHILEPILHTLKRMGDDFSLLSIEDAERVLRLGLISGDYTLTVAGQAVDVEPLVNKYRERYAGWIANNILDGVFAGLRGIKSVILVGGGALIVEDFMREWYGEQGAGPQEASDHQENLSGGLQCNRRVTLGAKSDQAGESDINGLKPGRCPSPHG